MEEGGWNRYKNIKHESAFFKEKSNMMFGHLKILIATYEVTYIIKGILTLVLSRLM